MSYDPTIGRWIQEDPSRFSAGDSNLDRYVNNDPTDATDPSGLAGWWGLDEWKAASYELLVVQGGVALSKAGSSVASVGQDFAEGTYALATSTDAWKAAGQAYVDKSKAAAAAYANGTEVLGQRIANKAEQRGLNAADASYLTLFDYGLEDFIGGRAVEAWHGFDAETGAAIEGDVFGGGERTQKLLLGSADFLNAVTLGLTAVSSVSGLEFSLTRATSSGALAAEEGAKAAETGLAESGSASPLDRTFSSKSTSEIQRIAEAPTSISQLRQKLGRAGMIDSKKVTLVQALAEEIPNVPGRTFFGWVSRQGGKLVTDPRGRVIINLTEDALASLKSAVETVGHELHHIGEALAGAGESEIAAENAAKAFLEQFLQRLSQVN
jgi:hypothetical protein